MNTERMQKVLEHIERNLDRWDQAEFARKSPYRSEPCNTIYCLAGWTIELFGGGWDWSAPFTPVPNDAQSRTSVELATELLGLTFEQAMDLFWWQTYANDVYDNTLQREQFERFVRHIHVTTGYDYNEDRTSNDDS